MQYFSCRIFGFRIAKILACQLIFTKLLSNNQWELDREEVIDIFSLLKVKYINIIEDRFPWLDNAEEYIQIREKFATKKKLSYNNNSYDNYNKTYQNINMINPSQASNLINNKQNNLN